VDGRDKPGHDDGGFSSQLSNSHTFAVSPHVREFCISYFARLKIRGRRESRVLVAPAASRAK